jgi:hypothetical protein
MPLKPYDDRIFRFVANDTVTIWRLAGRMKIPFVCGERQRDLLAYRKGEVDLMLVPVRGISLSSVACQTRKRSASRTCSASISVSSTSSPTIGNGRAYSGAV